MQKATATVAVNKDKHRITLSTDKYEHLPVLAKIILKWFSRTSCSSVGIHQCAAVKYTFTFYINYHHFQCLVSLVLEHKVNITSYKYV